MSLCKDKPGVLDRLHARHDARVAMQPSLDLSNLPRALAWSILCDHEPGLRRLEFAMRGKRRSWLNYEHFKRQASRLVGWECRNPLLRTSDAYDVAIAIVARTIAP